MEKVIEVVAAILWEDDKFLICQRPKGKDLADYWEFVGGKVEQGETLSQALVRECQEELAVTVEVGEFFRDVTHKYPHITIHLSLFHGKIISGSLRMLEHQDFRWISIEEIQQYVFCPADQSFLIALQEGI